MRRLNQGVGLALLVLGLTLGLAQSAWSQGFDGIHDCDFCHNFHGGFNPALLGAANAETVCVSCHGLTAPGTAGGGSDTKAEVHRNETTQYAPFYVTCLRCHNPHVDQRNWLPGHVDDIAAPPAELMEGMNVKHVGRPFPGPTSVSAGTRILARGAIIADHTAIPTVGPIPTVGVDLIDGGETAGVHLEDRFLRNDAGSWITDGYQKGARVTVANVTNASACGLQLFRDESSFKVTSVTASTLGVEAGALFASPTVVGPLPRRSGFDFVDGGAGTDSIVRTDGGSWIADGYQAGCEFTVVDAEDPENDGTYAIVSVTASDLTLASGSVVTPVTDDNQAIITQIPLTQVNDTAVTFDGEINAYIGVSSPRWFAPGQGIVVEGYTANPDQNDGFATVETLLSDRIVVWPYRVDPANNICGGAVPCSLVANPNLVDETPSATVTIYPSATVLSVELDPDADGLADQDPDGVVVGPVATPNGFDFVDGGTGAGDDSVVRNDGGSWLADGYRIGLKFPVTGAETPANDGTYTVASVSASSLVVEEQVTGATDDNTAVVGGGLTTADCEDFNTPETNCCYASGRRQVVFEHLNEGGDILHSFSDENQDVLVGPDRQSPDPLLAFGLNGTGGLEAGTGAWDGGCGETCHTIAQHHRTWCVEDLDNSGDPTGLCDTTSGLGHDAHNSNQRCTRCHEHGDGFGRASPQDVVFGPDSCSLY
jgi:predicted CXXCH cytochrome family protein